MQEELHYTVSIPAAPVAGLLPAMRQAVRQLTTSGVLSPGERLVDIGLHRQEELLYIHLVYQKTKGA